MAFYTYIDYFKRNHRHQIARGKKVIDIGSGHAPLIRADVLCDMFPLDAAERAVSAIFMPDGRFVIGDITDLPFKDKSFDTVICDPPWAKRERLDAGLSGKWLNPSSAPSS